MRIHQRSKIQLFGGGLGTREWAHQFVNKDDLDHLACRGSQILCVLRLIRLYSPLLMMCGQTRHNHNNISLLDKLFYWLATIPDVSLDLKK